ncbi:MAG: hypothetical protein WC668_04755 [Patescibacteria group bacterium]|jgi:hypothetical protein
MIGFSGTISFTADQPLHYEVKQIGCSKKNKRQAKYRVRIYQCEGVCPGGICDDKRKESCRKLPIQTTTILETKSVFDSWEKATDWGDKCSNLIWILSQLSKENGKEFVELNIG